MGQGPSVGSWQPGAPSDSYLCLISAARKTNDSYLDSVQLVDSFPKHGREKGSGS